MIFKIIYDKMIIENNNPKLSANIAPIINIIREINSANFTGNCPEAIGLSFFIGCLRSLSIS
jgi:hypothetical protein